MVMFDSRLLKRLRYLSLLARRAGGRSLFDAPGSKSEAVALRDYAPGDDYRHVDWTLCARRDELMTRKFPANEDRHVYVLLDCSRSMGLGQPSKFDLARQVAAALGYAALTELSCLSLTGFSDGLVAENLPMRGAGRTAKLLGLLNRMELHGDRTDLTRTAKSFVRRYQRHGPVVIISDLYDPDGFEPGLNVLRDRGYEPRIVQIHAPAEADPRFVGEVELFDVESQAVRRVLVTERVARRYREAYARFQRSVRQYCVRHGVACMQVVSDAAVDDVVLTVLGGQRSAFHSTSPLSLKTR